MTREQAAWLKKPYIEENPPHYLFADLGLEPERKPATQPHINYSALFVGFSILAGIGCVLFEWFGK